MNNLTQLRISIIGAGNVAHALSHSMLIGGVKIVEIFNRDKEKAEKLAYELGGIKVVDKIEILDTTVDAVAVLVKDDAIEEVARQIPKAIDRFHVSGVTEREVLGGVNGVIWPIKSFNSESKNDSLESVPFGIDASCSEFREKLDRIVDCVGGQGFSAPSEVRSKVHLAAVFSDNFTNHCLAISQQILKDSGLPSDLMQSLVKGLLIGASSGNSYERQTGVAIRGDEGSMQKHLDIIQSFDNNEQLSEFYDFLSKHIAISHNNNK
tara:strand:+ start:40 stop:834 length:795 start_codon:yes stop_codon:yes gene_type:complete